MSKSGESLGN